MAEERYGYCEKMGLIFDGTECLTMKEVASRLNRDDDLLKRAVSGLKSIGRFHYPDEPTEPHSLDCSLAGRVSHVFLTGMTRSIELCRRFDQDPEYNEAKQSADIEA